MKLICCNGCKSINVDKIEIESVEIGRHWKQQLHYPWEEELIKEYEYYEKYKCKDCGLEFKEKS